MYKIILPAFVALFCAQLLSAQCVQFNCPTQPNIVCALQDNNPQFWNETYWLDPSINSHDLAEAAADLQFRVKDICGGATLAYALLLDLDANGSLETRISSDSAQLLGKVPFGNALTPGGTARTFDERPVTTALKYRFSLQQTIVGDTIRGRVRWNTLQTPDTYIDAQLPLGTHRIIWYVRTATTVDSCVQTLIVRDCKKPTVVCLGGLSVNIMPTQFIQLWATDFLQYAVDNVTPAGQLQIGIVRSELGTGQFPTDSLGNPKVSVVFTCDTLGTLAVQLWAKDNAGNISYCETYISVQDNNNNCVSNPSGLEVCVYNEANQLIENVEFGLQGATPGIPPIIIPGTTVNGNGCWVLPNSVPLGSTVTVTPIKDDNHINGLSTFDLILITKHILNIEPLTSPYKMIAADANKSNSITSFDIVEFKKLVLGIYTELPNNTSWRFVDKAFVFPYPGNPWATTFPEDLHIGINTNMVSANFIGIKIGDLNGNAVTGNLSGGNVEARTTSNITLPDLSLRAGSTIDIPLQTSEAAQWLGFQAGLQFDPQNVDIEIVGSAALPDFDASSWAKPQPGRLNVSWFTAQPQTLVPGENLLTLRVHARTDVRLRDALTLDNKLLRAEAYSDQEIAQNLSLQFREQPTLAENTAIFPAQPNPTTAGAMIPLRLQSAEKVILEVFDATGKQVFQQANSLTAGSQMIEIPGVVLQASGVYTWRMQAGAVVQAGKVVRE